MNNSFELEKGRIFVGGLHWQALSGTQSEAKGEAQRLAKQLSFDLAVWRTSGALQIGYASLADGYKPGMLSAAAVVSKTIEVESGERDFLCATELPDGRFLYVAQADGVIPPEGDSIDSEEAIRARMLEDLSIGRSWGLIIAPVMWGIPDSVERPFRDFIPKKGGRLDFKHSWWALKPVKQSFGSITRKLLPFAVIGGIALVSFAGLKHWQLEQAAKEAAKIASMQANEPPREIPHPWKDKPRAQLAVAACATGLEKIGSLWPGNWKLEAIVCSPSGGSLTISWRKGEYGWIKHLLEVEPKANVSTDGSTATLTLPLQTTGAEDEALIDERTRSKQLFMTAQQYGLNLSLSAPQMPPPLPGSTPNSQPAAWQELSWAVKGSSLSPESIVATLDGAGFRVNSVTARYTDGLIKWDLEGMQYVLP